MDYYSLDGIWWRPMEWKETEKGVWRSGEYEIRHIWFTPRESWDLYRNGQAIGGYDTFAEAKLVASQHS